MPSPGIYVVAVVVGVAAGIAFKEFVYDPHVAPKIEQWTDAYAAYLSERRRRRTMPHSRTQSHSYSDDEGDAGRGKELERPVEREMHTLDRGATLRKRLSTSLRDGNGVEMMEKPNGFIPFVPLAPTPPLHPNPFSNSEAALPIGRLPTPVSDHAPSLSPLRTRPPVANPFAASQTRSRTSSSGASSPESHRRPPSPQQRIHRPIPKPFISHDASSPSPSTSPPPPHSPFDLAFPAVESHAGSRAPSRAWSDVRSGSEYDFTRMLHPHQSVGADSPFTSAGVSRSVTPFTDARSEASFSEAEFVDGHSESERSESSLDFLGSDADAESEAGSEAEFVHAQRGALNAAASEADDDAEFHTVHAPSANAQFFSVRAPSRAMSGGGSQRAWSDAELVRPQSAMSAAASESEWERVSEAGR